MTRLITTKYCGPGVRSSRIKATSGSGISKYVEYDPALSAVDNHKAGVIALMIKLNWEGELVSGQSRTGEIYWVFVDKNSDRVCFPIKMQPDCRICNRKGCPDLGIGNVYNCTFLAEEGRDRIPPDEEEVETVGEEEGAYSFAEGDR